MPPTQQERLFWQLEAQGYKVTEPRRQIIKQICSFSGYFGAGHLLQRVEEQAPAIGRATVFRTLQLLCDVGLLERLRLESGQEAYVLGHACHHHHHMVCSRCGRVEEIEGCGVESYIEKVAKERGFVLNGHALEMFGHCAACNQGGA